MSQGVIATAEALAGVGGALFSTSIVYPLQIAQTRLQLQDKRSGGPVYKNSFHAIKVIAETEGLQALYGSIGSEYFQKSIKNFTFYGCYSLLKDVALHLNPSKDPDNEGEARRLGTGHNLVVGFLAGCMVVLATNPINVVQTRLQAGHSRGFLRTFWRVARAEGLAGLYAGLVPSLVLSSYPAIQNLVYDRIKRWLLQAKAGGASTTAGGDDGAQEQQLTALESFLAGCVANITAILTTYPYIFAKVRMQSGLAENRSALSFLLFVARTRGIFGWYQGMSSQILKSVLSNSLMFVGKEQINSTARRLVFALLSLFVETKR